MHRWMIAKNVVAPGRRFVRRARGFSGSLVVTEKRIVCFAYWKHQIDISIEDPRISQIFVDVHEEEGTDHFSQVITIS